MKKDLEIIRSAITLPGAALTKIALIFDKEISDEQLGKIGIALTMIEGCRSWWIGDYGAALVERKGQHYTATNAEALGVEASTFWGYVSTARFFKASVRTESLSFAHHYVAMRGSTPGDVDAARGWLEKAKEGGWSVSELRKQIRLSKATMLDNEPGPEENEFKLFDSADEWAARNSQRVLSGTGPEQARILLETRFLALVQMVDALREIAAKEIAP